MALSSSHTPTTRLAKGKKIDTWQVFHGADKARMDIEVHMIADHDHGMFFRASSPHRLLYGKSWEDTDLNRLREACLAEIETILADHHATDWDPALRIKTQFGTHPQKDSFHLRVDIDRIHVAKASWQSNDGSRELIYEGRRFTDREAAPGDGDRQAPGSIRIGDPEAQHFLPRSPEIDRGLERMIDTLDAFSQALAARLSIADPGPKPPSPDDLVEMMRAAAEGVTATQGQDPLGS